MSAYQDPAKAKYKLIVDPAGKFWLVHPDDPIPDLHYQIFDQVVYYYGQDLLAMFCHLPVFGGIHDNEPRGID